MRLPAPEKPDSFLVESGSRTIQRFSQGIENRGLARRLLRRAQRGPEVLSESVCYDKSP